MSTTTKPTKRPEFRNINLSDLMGYASKMPIAAKVSILHRISGLLMALLLPAKCDAGAAPLKTLNPHKRTA